MGLKRNIFARMGVAAGVAVALWAGALAGAAEGPGVGAEAAGGAGGTGGAERAKPFVSTRIEPMPPEFQGVTVDEKLGKKLPLELDFFDEDGKPVTLGQFLGRGKPVILQMGYFGCPKLCSQIAQGTLESLKKLDLNMGDEFEVVYVSIDPTEKVDLARQTKQSYVRQYTMDGGRDLRLTKEGWHFLTGSEGNIKQLADAIGFRYKWVESAQQFSHPAVLTFVAPDGTVTRYLYGVAFDPTVMKLSLGDASKGKVGSIMDKIIMMCFHDLGRGTYSQAAMTTMRIGGVVTVVLIGGVIGLMIIKGNKMRGIESGKPRQGLSAVMSGGAGGAGGGPELKPRGFEVKSSNQENSP